MIAAAAWSPLEITALVTAIGAILVNSIVGIAALIVAISGLKKVTDVNTKVDGMLVQRDATNVAEGERKATAVGVATAATLAEGQKQGRDSERERHPLSSDQPLPVADDRVAAASESVAASTERIAAAAEKPLA